MNGHLLRCQSALRAHVRLSTLRAQDLLPPCIWPSLNRLQHPNTRTHSQNVRRSDLFTIRNPRRYFNVAASMGGARRVRQEPFVDGTAKGSESIGVSRHSTMTYV